jgi:DNA mismatch endonuclease (patch repair protein)
MKNTRRRDTPAEMALRRAIHRKGLRYLVDAPVLGTRRRADILFRGAHVAVFVDGCFWHSCPIHGTLPKENREWWQQKLAANDARDRNTDELLRRSGWEVIRVWEHEDMAEAARRIQRVVTDRRAFDAGNPCQRTRHPRAERPRASHGTAAREAASE